MTRSSWTSTCRFGRPCPDPRIDAVRGCLAFERGPLVYCLETADLPGDVQLEEVEVDPAVRPVPVPRPDIADSAIGLTVPATVGAWRRTRPPGRPPEATPVEVGAVPYFTWANRSVDAMRVWIPIDRPSIKRPTTASGLSGANALRVRPQRSCCRIARRPPGRRPTGRLPDNERRLEDHDPRLARQARIARKRDREFDTLIDDLGDRHPERRQCGNGVGGQKEVVEADDGQFVGHGPAQAVGGMEDADCDQVGGGHHGRRRLVQVEQRPERGFAPGQAVVDGLDVALRDAPESVAHEFGERVLALPVVAGQEAADERDPFVAQPDQVLEAGDDPGAFVDVDGRELKGAGSLPRGDDRDGGMTEVVEQARLVLHVPEHDDRIGVAGLEDRSQGDPLVHPAVGVAQHDVVAARHRLDGERLDDGGEEWVAEVPDDCADQHRRRPAQAPGVRIGPVPSSRAATITRSRVSAAIGTRVGASLSTRETVLWETPATLAMSRMVGTRRDCAASRRLRPVSSPGPRFPPMSSMQA